MYDPRNTLLSQQNPSYNNGKNLDNWYGTDHGALQFRPNNNQESGHGNGDDGSGVCSPPLWKNSPSPSHPLLDYYDGSNNNYRSMSPDSRTQAIVRGQWELMEMVKDMPESSYELSLKDLVEHHHRADVNMSHSSPENNNNNNNNNNLQQRGAAVRQKVVKQEIGKKSGADSKSVVTRNVSFEKKINRNSNNNKGLVLNLVCPFSVKKLKKKKGFNGSSSGRVSPRPDVGLKSGGDQKDWWKKKFTGSTDSDSSRTSSNSGGSSSSGTTTSSGGSSVEGGRSRKNNGVVGGCWPFFKSRRSKIVE